MRYELLGPLRVVTDDGQVASIGAPKIETLLAVLLVRADRIVTTDHLMAEIWEDRVPRRAMAGLHVYVSQLRKFLSRCGHADSPIVTQPPGYEFRSGSDEIDYRLFLRLVEWGHEHARARRHDRAARCFEQALSMWHEPVIADFCRGSIVEGFLARLTEARLECTEALVESQLAMGRHRELVGRLYALTAEHPLRETFSFQLMLALYRSDRQGEALDVYRSVRRTINEELGLEPCHAIQDLQRGILAADLDLNRWATV